jgi:hypothetical protein
LALLEFVFDCWGNLLYRQVNNQRSWEFFTKIRQLDADEASGPIVLLRPPHITRETEVSQRLQGRLIFEAFSGEE